MPSIESSIAWRRIRGKNRDLLHGDDGGFMKKSMLYKAVLVAMLATSSSAALAVDETEFNSPIQTANRVVVGGDGSVVINATLSGIGDVDYFSFEGKDGDIVKLDIDGGMT